MNNDDDSMNCVVNAQSRRQERSSLASRLARSGRRSASAFQCYICVCVYVYIYIYICITIYIYIYV